MTIRHKKTFGKLKEEERDIEKLNKSKMKLEEILDFGKALEISLVWVMSIKWLVT